VEEIVIIFYLVGLSFILLVIASVLAKMECNLEKKNYYYLLGCSAFGLYLYLSSFLIIYIDNADAPSPVLQDLVYLNISELKDIELQFFDENMRLISEQMPQN